MEPKNGSQKMAKCAGTPNPYTTRALGHELAITILRVAISFLETHFQDHTKIR